MEPRSQSKICLTHFILKTVFEDTIQNLQEHNFLKKPDWDITYFECLPTLFDTEEDICVPFGLSPKKPCIH